MHPYNSQSIWREPEALLSLKSLAYFNITVEETQGEGLGDKKHYFGLPVTTTALIFPTFNPHNSRNITPI